ncbi:FAD-binding protein [Sedimentitalea sp. XS_ASV28]|uniref:FAD-binding protein n=1 Tax=Sedimentitalea sp. XS_ASV28 TaxID=3241296 RepID=UPI003513B8AA
MSEPPFYGYSLRIGVTFTYLGLKVNERAQCSIGDRAATNLWAAGETMAGSILGQGYLAGFGMTIGTVFGRIAGRKAAAHAWPRRFADLFDRSGMSITVGLIVCFGLLFDLVR